MRMMLSWKPLLLLTLITVGATVLYGRSPERQQLSNVVIVPQPATWVPFSADIKRVGAEKGTVWVGRFYRASDGSTRSETGRSLDSIDTVGIKNIEGRTFYLWSKSRGSWTAQPMDLPPWGWQPRPRHLSPRMGAVAQKVEGFDLMLSINKQRMVYESPQLNFFPLVAVEPCAVATATACGVWHSNIVLGEQPPSYFLPQAGASLEWLSEPGGIVNGSKH